jgi:hypothetical protein
MEEFIEVIICVVDCVQWDDSAVRWPWSRGERRSARPSAPVSTGRDPVVASPAERSAGAIRRASEPAKSEFAPS